MVTGQTPCAQCSSCSHLRKRRRARLPGSFRTLRPREASGRRLRGGVRGSCEGSGKPQEGHGVLGHLGEAAAAAKLHTEAEA